MTVRCGGAVAADIDVFFFIFFARAADIDIDCFPAVGQSESVMLPDRPCVGGRDGGVGVDINTHPVLDVGQLEDVLMIDRPRVVPPLDYFAFYPVQFF